MKNQNKQSKRDKNERPDIIVANAVAKAIETVANAAAKILPKLSGKQLSSLAEKIIKTEGKNTKAGKNKDDS